MPMWIYRTLIWTVRGTRRLYGYWPLLRLHFLTEEPSLPSNYPHHLLQPILLASVTSPDPALPTLKDILRESMITLFALMGPSNPPPVLVQAIMAVAEILNRLLHLHLLFRGGQSDSRPVTRHDLFRSSHQAGFIPLVAGTGLPALSADVAEFSAAGTSHVIATHIQFYHYFAVVATLPPLLPCGF